MERTQLIYGATNMNHKKQEPAHGTLKMVRENGSHYYVDLCQCHKAERIDLQPNPENLASEVQSALNVVHDRIQKHKEAARDLREEVVSMLDDKAEEIDSRISGIERVVMGQSDKIQEMQRSLLLLHLDFDAHRNRGFIKWLKRCLKPS